MRETTSSVNSSPRNGEQILTLWERLRLPYVTLQLSMPVQYGLGPVIIPRPCTKRQLPHFYRMPKTHHHKLFVPSRWNCPTWYPKRGDKQTGKVQSNARPKPYAARIPGSESKIKIKKKLPFSTPLLTRPSEVTRLELWKDRLRVSPPKLALNIKPAEAIASGHLASWAYWKCRNRLRTGVVRSKSTLAQWGLNSGPALCRCDSAEDTAGHLLRCPLPSRGCALLDLSNNNNIAEATVKFWMNYV